MVAYGALLLWPIVIFVLFWQLPGRQAVIWAILASYLLLPVRTAFDFPGVPPLDKTSIPSLATLLAALLVLRQRSVVTPRQGLVTGLMLVFIVSPFFTAINNGDPLLLSSRAIPGMTYYDALSVCAGQVITLIPFMLGYALLGDERGHREILLALGIAGLAYSLPMLFEVRMSPQLHRLAYGFFPHTFGQQVREGGFRPVVFLGHGLLVAIFCSMTLLAIVAFWRERRKLLGMSAGALTGYLAVVLILCKSLGALVLAAVFTPLLMLAKPRRMVMISAVVAAVILVYPAVRGSGLFPLQTVSAMAGSISEERMGSLDFRFENEEKLLEKANQRPAFGWGTWGRNRIYDGYDDADTSVTDGTWIMTVGNFGWVGYIATFGLLCYPLIARASRKGGSRDVPLASASLGIVLLINMIDLVPNSSLSPLTWLIAGALGGAVMHGRQPREEELRPASEISA